jgi:hypothetical protein
MLKIVINRHYQHSIPISKDVQGMKKKQKKKMKEESIGMTMYLMKHGRTIESEDSSGNAIIDIIGEPDNEPSNPRIYYENQ